MFSRLILAALVAVPVALPAAAQTQADPTPGPPSPGAPGPGEIALMLTPDGHTQFTLITPGGHVGFAAGDWQVLKAHGDLPSAGFDFQVPDAADQGTEESTNISIDVYQPDTRADRDAQADFGKSLEPAGRPKKETYNGWTIYSQSLVAKGTPYTIIDAESRQADTDVIVHLNWPHLTGQPGTHNADMRTMLLKTLDSVSAGTGPYALHPGEVVRRAPAQ
jgi:hypothetical protein